MPTDAGSTPRQPPHTTDDKPPSLLWREIDEQDRATIPGIKKTAVRFGRQQIDDKVNFIGFIGLSGLIGLRSETLSRSNHEIQKDLAHSALKQVKNVLEGVGVDAVPGAVACYAHPERMKNDNFHVYNQLFAEQYLLPRVAHKAEDGSWRKRPVEEARRNMRLNLYDHSFGAVQVTEIRHHLRDKMKEIGFLDQEIAHVFQNVLEISFAPSLKVEPTETEMKYVDSPPYFTQLMFFAEKDSSQEFFWDTLSEEGKHHERQEATKKRPVYIVGGAKDSGATSAHSADCIYDNMPKSLKKLIAFGISADDLPENFGQWNLRVQGMNKAGDPRIIRSENIRF